MVGALAHGVDAHIQPPVYASKETRIGTQSYLRLNSDLRGPIKAVTEKKSMSLLS